MSTSLRPYHKQQYIQGALGQTLITAKFQRNQSFCSRHLIHKLSANGTDCNRINEQLFNIGVQKRNESDFDTVTLAILNTEVE